MTTSDLIAELDSMPVELLGLRAARAGEDLELELTTSGALLTAGRQIADLAESQGCQSILGASGLGERISGAAIAVAANGLSIFDPTKASERVLVLDGVLASGANLARAAARVRGAGTKYVVAAALISANPSPSQAVPGADLVVVLDLPT